MSEEHDDIEDVDVDITLTTKGPEADALKEMLRKGDGVKNIRAVLSNYVSALKNEYSQDLIKPKKGDAAPEAVKKQAVAKPVTTQGQAHRNNETSLQNLDIGGVKMELAEINIEEEMKCTGQELFNALTRKDMIQIFTGGEAKMHEQAIEGGTFELLGGNITGKYIEVCDWIRLRKI